MGISVPLKSPRSCSN